MSYSWTRLACSTALLEGSMLQASLSAVASQHEATIAADALLHLPMAPRQPFQFLFVMVPSWDSFGVATSPAILAGAKSIGRRFTNRCIPTDLEEFKPRQVFTLRAFSSLTQRVQVQLCCIHGQAWHIGAPLLLA